MANHDKTFSETTNKDRKNSNRSNKTAHSPSFPPALDSGDVVLFNRRCTSMSVAGAALCFVAKVFSNSQWDHVGIVIRHPATGELLFLEADFGGVKLRPLDERVRRSKSNEIAVRRLSLVRTTSMREKFYAFAQEMIGRPYEIGTGSVLARVSDPLGKQERERLSALLLHKQAQVEDISRELEKNSHSSLTRRLLQTERTRIIESCKRVEKHLSKELDASDPVKKQFPISSRSAETTSPHEPDLSRVFCSELAAAAYQRVGLLGSYPPAFHYNPKDFSSDQTHPPGLHLLKNARLSPELYVRRLQRRGRDRAAAEHHARPSIKGIEDGTAPSKVSRAFIREALKRTPLYNVVLDEGRREHLLNSFRAHIVEPGGIIFEQGQYGNKCYIVAEGEVERYIQKGTEDPILVSSMGPRASFGMTAFMFNTPRVSTVRAKERTLIWELDRPTFELFRDAGSDAKSILFATDNRRLRHLLKDHFLFRRFDKIGANEVDAFFLVNFQAGETVFRQGDTGDNFYIIKSGELEREIRRPISHLVSNEELGSSDPIDNSTVNIIRPNESFGELSIMFNAPRGATVRARTDTVCWAISAESFHRLNLSGGTQHLRAVFNKNASVVQNSETYMTRADLLKFVNMDVIPETERDRLSALLISLVTSNRLRDPIQPSSPNPDQSGARPGSRFLQNDDFLMDFWEFVRFDNILNQPSAEATFAFLLADQDNTGLVSHHEVEDIWCAYHDLFPVEDERRNELGDRQAQVFGRDRSKSLSFREFSSLSHRILPTLFLRDVEELTKHLLHIEISGVTELQARREILNGQAMPRSDHAERKSEPQPSSDSADVPYRGVQDSDQTIDKSEEVLTSSIDLGHLLAVGLSGLVSRSAVAPLERLKILMQVSDKEFSRGWVDGLREMMKRDSSVLKGLFRGNGTNLLRLLPSATIQVIAVDQLRRASFPRALSPESFPTNKPSGEVVSKGASNRMTDAIAIGGVSGMIAATAVYPIDFIRARLTVQQRGFEPYQGFFHAAKSVALKEGPGTLYRGLGPTLAGVFPYVGLSFAIYEIMRPILPKKNDKTGTPTTSSTVVSGIMASAVGQVASYPLDTCRRRMQVARFSGDGLSPTTFSGVWSDVQSRWGWRGFFRGIMPGLLKIGPASVLSFLTYEELRSRLSPDMFGKVNVG